MYLPQIDIRDRSRRKRDDNSQRRRRSDGKSAEGILADSKILANSRLREYRSEHKVHCVKQNGEEEGRRGLIASIEARSICLRVPRNDFLDFSNI